ncbi:MAG: DoxX family membrane protein [Candidatus Marinimicrobia bacterium]|nr:DoxX family membrane protein [Candidatus Neomarinimicrobiota bacterium]
MSFRDFSILLLRVSIGLLLVFWGLDKLVNTEHAMAVSDTFYLGLFSQAVLLKIFGVVETLIGIVIILGIWRKYSYPLMILMNAVSALGVWKSIVDPWGWYLQDTNVLFYPSLIILAGSLVLLAFLEFDNVALDIKLEDE